MDQESIVYGCIKDTALDNVAERRRVNRDAMISLPPVETWPVLSREMFSAQDQQTEDSSLQSEVMHFGASYQGVEYEWKHWMEQFEALLKKMYWVSATVHLETEMSGTHSFVWETNKGQHEPGSDDIQIRCEWVHEGWMSN